MSWTSSHGVDANIGLMVGRDVEIRFLVNPQHPATITLVIGESIAEIMFDPSTVETLLDKAGEAVGQLREAVAKHQADAPGESAIHAGEEAD